MDVVSTLPEALHTQFVTLRVMFLQDAKKKNSCHWHLKTKIFTFILSVKRNVLVSVRQH